MQKEFTIVTASKTPINIQRNAPVWGNALSDLGSNDFALIPIVGATNIADAYNSVLDKIQTEFVIWAHDDAMPFQLPSYKCGKRLYERASACDVMGFCGSHLWTGGGWQESGRGFGVVINTSPPPAQAADGSNIAQVLQDQRMRSVGMYMAGAASWDRPARLVRGIRAADGYCVVTRTEAIRELKWWVPSAAPHFHHYDVDLFLRAFNEGYRTAVCCDVYVMHQSHGSYDQPQWADGVPEIHKKHAGTADPRPRGIFQVHRTLQGPDARVVLQDLQNEEQWMQDEVTLRESPNGAIS